MDIRVHIVGARNLLAKDANGLSDPYARCEIVVPGDKKALSKQATPVVLKNLNPKWDYFMDFSIPEVHMDAAELRLRVWDKDFVGKEFLGEVSIKVAKLGNFDAEKAKWVPLNDEHGKPSTKNGDIEFRAGRIVVHGRTVLMSHVPDSFSATASDASAPVVDESPSTDHLKLSLDEIKSVIGVLELDVLRCTNLPSDNPKSLTFDCDPFVIVMFSTHTYKTRIIKHSQNPTFNERILLPIMAGDKQFPIRFSVYDYDRLSNNDFLGSASIMVSSVLDETEQQWTYKLDLKKDNGGQTSLIHFQTKFVPYEELKRRFFVKLAEQFDSDGNGTINLMEFATLLDELGSTLSEEQAETIFQSFCQKGETCLTFDELSKCLDSIAHESDSRLLTLERDPLTNKPLPKGDRDALVHLALSATFKPEVVDRLVVGGLISEAYARKGWIGRAVNFMTRGVYDASKGNANILVRDRRDGRLHDEEMPSYVRLGIRLLYQTTSRKGLDQKAIRDIFIAQSVKQGRKFDDPASAKSIPSFIKFHKLNTEEILDPLDSFKTFNEFFYRKLKPSARQLASPDPRVLVSAADARTMVFPTIDEATRVWVKGSEFSLEHLFDSKEMAQHYSGGSMCIFRLAPQDYHRFHSPVDGVLGEMRPTGNHLFTVNPMAVRGDVNVYTENKRIVTEIQSEAFGKVALVIIGAMMVGSINITAVPGKRIARMDELGYFAFGGSTVIMITEKNKIKFDADLLDNSSKQIETLVAVGNSIATAN